LRRCIAELARRAEELLHEGDGLETAIADWRLGLEISVIHALALRVTRVLTVSDPLSAETHLGKWRTGGIGLLAVLKSASRRFGSRGRSPALASRP